MKKAFTLLLILVLCVGCTRIDNEKNLDVIVNSVFTSGAKKANTTSLGYKYYLPLGVTKVYDKDYNQKLKVGENYIYLYADVVSYYYQNNLNLNDTETDSYYYRHISNNGHDGYIKVDNIKDDNCHNIKIVYNYTKIESCVKNIDIKTVLTDSLIILDSIEYNDKLIKKILDEGYLSGAEKEYKIDKPEGTESKFNEYLSEYVGEEEQIPELPDY